MDARVRSAATLTVLSLLVVVAAVVGWRAATAPLPAAVETPDCIDTRVAVGDEVFPDQVAVSVFNGSRQNGIAARTLDELVDRGFHGVRTGNAPKKIKGIEIWATNAKNPAVELVASQFRQVKVVQGEALGPGVVVVVGDGAKKMRAAAKAKPSVKATSIASICTPPGVDEITQAG